MEHAMLIASGVLQNYTVPALDMDFDQAQQTFEVNVFAVMRLCQTFSRAAHQSKGRLSR
jgi:1-acylglycerone phosphate reductase